MATIYYHGLVRTMSEQSGITDAVVTEDGVILDTGSEHEMRARYGDRISREIDMKGGCMYPGFTDSHLHMIGHGEKLLTLDVSTAASIETLQEKLREKARATPVGEWVIAEGFNDNLFPDKRIPDRQVLDEVSTDHPILITRVCRHAVAVNSMAINQAGLSKQTPDPSGGRIERYPDGEPTGYLHDQAQELVKYCLPVQKFADIERALHTSVQDLLAHGFTGGHSEDLFYYGNPVETVRVFEDVINGKDCKFRTSLLVHHEAAKVVFDTYPDGPRPSFIDFNAVKIFTDGALGGRTAYLSEPYADHPDTCGVAIHTQEQLTALVSLARSYRMPVAVHAIGDQALEETLTALEAHPPPSGKRDRIIHAQILRPELIQRMKDLPVVLDLQPRFTISDFPWVIDRLGEERIRNCYAWKTLLDEGLMCAGGSDAPIEPVSPMEGIYAAVMRRKPEDQHEGYLPDQKLNLEQAIGLYTHGAAQAVGMEHRRGRIQPGFDADFTILEADLYPLAPEEWLSVKTRMTIVDDTVMYESDL